MKNILWLLIVGLMLGSCGGSEEDNENSTQEGTEILPDLDSLKSELVKLENDINSTMDPSDEILKKGILKFQEFAGFYPDDPQAPDYLLKASDFSYQTKQFEKSVKLLDRIIHNYPDYSRLEDVYFNKASHIDFELRDTTRAKEAYREFIDKYPESELVDDAESRIKYISYSAEDLIEMFEQNLLNQAQ